jgi:hypothetical protein
LNYRKTGKIAVWDFRPESSRDHHTIAMQDDDIFNMVDDDVEDIEFLFSDSRYIATLDEWLDRKTLTGWRYMPLTMMDKR